MGNIKVAIIGAGRLARLVAGRLPANVRRLIISRRKAAAGELADEVGGIASDQLSAVRGADFVLLAVPAGAVGQVVREVAPHLGPNAVLVNMATELLTDQLAAEFPELRFAAAKIVGEAREMQQGSPGIVVLDHVEEAEEELLRAMFRQVGPVIREDEARVLAVGAAIVEQMVRAEAELRARLGALGLTREMAATAIAGTAPGVLRSLAEGTAGPFAQQVIARLRVGEVSSPPG